MRCPQILDVTLWKKSGHWDNYKDNMFFTESEKRTYAVKPMNCPGHVQVFNQGLHSYRDLPIRYGEFGACHRNEPSGALHGILRVRGFTQDDGHVFCTEAQIEPEVRAFHQQALKVYADFGFSDIQIKIALRPESRLGDDATWDKAEDALRGALRASGVEWEELPGEGAFYGPKIEYHLKDAIGRTWQLGTMQVDFMMPGRLGAEYVDETQPEAPPGDAAPGDRGLDGAFHRHPDRTPCRPLPGLAGAGAGGGDEHHRCPGRLASRTRGKPLRIKASGWFPICGTRKSAIRFASTRCSACRTCWWSGTARRKTACCPVRTRGGEDLGTMSVADFATRLRQEQAA